MSNGYAQHSGPEAAEAKSARRSTHLRRSGGGATFYAEYVRARAYRPPDRDGCRACCPYRDSARAPGRMLPAPVGSAA